MKKLLILFCVLSFCAQSLWASSLAETFSHRVKPVEVYVELPVNRSEDPAIVPADVQKAFEDALKARRQPRFNLQSDAAAAEILVSIQVVESIFSEHDPVDKLIGIGGTAWDAMRDEHYARLTAVLSIKDGKSGRVLWTDKLKATVTDAVMTREESRPKVLARSAEIFIREAFGKKRR